MIRIAAAVLLGLVASGAQPQGPLPLFDAHLHYNDDAQAAYPLVDVFARFRDAGVTTILATSRPNDGTKALLVGAARAGAAAPRVVPFIRPYRNAADRDTWFNDPAIFALIEAELARPIHWRGIGEFHVFGADADTPWVRKIVAIAVRHDLWLHAHCDDAALERLLAHDPRVKVIWAHTGFSTPPVKIQAYFAKHPNLIGELSYRYDVTHEGRLAPEWRTLFLRFPERFVLGSDTWVNARWAQYAEIMAYYRGWLAELPPDVAAAIAHRNGERLFGNGR